jgi:hypothetical protein
MGTLIVYAIAVVVSAGMGAAVYQCGYKQGLRHGLARAEANAYAIAMRDARALVTLGSLGTPPTDRGAA